MTGTELAGTELEEVPKPLSPFQISYFTFYFHISLSHFTFTTARVEVDSGHGSTTSRHSPDTGMV